MRALPEEEVDGELIALARRSDLAFEKLFANYRGKVYGLAVRMTRDPFDAEEVVQETFLSAWQNLPSFRGESAFGSWLYRICANFSLMRLRRRRVEGAEAVSLLEQSSEAPCSELAAEGTRGVEEAALDGELRCALQLATEGLSHVNREVFLLKDLEGLSYEEIAATVGVSLQTVKSRLHRARLALRQAIDQFYEQPARALAS